VWKRVVGELALIVGGVLIALALDAWWDGRQERKQETAYMTQLLVDLQETQSRLRASIAGDTETMEFVGAVLERAFSGPFPPADSLRLPTGYTQFRPLTGTQVALVQGGDLRLLRNDSLRFALIAYAALIDATEAILRHTESLIWNSTERVTLGRARHAQSIVPTRENGMRRWGQIDVVAALNDPELVSALQLQATASQNRVRNLQRLEDPTSDLIRLLETELGRR
jgi:hypothetical protein